MTQLRSLARPPAVQPFPSLQWPASQFSSTYPHSSYNTPYLAPPPEKTEPIASMALASSALASSASAPAENAGANLQISSILSSLMKSGLVSAIDTSSDSKVPPTEQEPKKELEPPVPAAEDLTAIRDARMDYRKRILAERSETLNVENDMYAFYLTQRTNQSQTQFLQ